MKKSKWTRRKVTQLRKQLGLNQSDFANALGINRQQTVSDWEVGKFDKIRPAHSTLLDILNEKAKTK